MHAALLTMSELNGLENERLQIIQLLNGEDIATEESAQAVPEPQVSQPISASASLVTEPQPARGSTCVGGGRRRSWFVWGTLPVLFFLWGLGGLQ